MANSLELLMVEQILTNLTNSKLKFDVAKPTISDNQDFFQRDVEALEYTITIVTLKLERYSSG